MVHLELDNSFQFSMYNHLMACIVISETPYISKRMNLRDEDSYDN